MNFRSAALLASLSFLAGCALVYSYGDYKDQDAGHGGTGTASAGTAGGTGTRSASSNAASSNASGNAGTGGVVASSSSASGNGGAVSSSAGTGGTGTSSASAGSSSTSSSTGGPCASGSTCAPVPFGWTGPIALETGATMPACTEAGWSTADPAASGGTSITAVSDCTLCSCTGPSNGSCSGSVSATGYSTTACGGTATDITLTTTCHAGFPYYSVQAPATKGSGATCGASMSMQTTQPAFTAYAAGCAGGTVGACPGGACALPASHLCVYATGSQNCPATYPSMTMVYGSFQDDRTCSPCSCSVTDQGDCAPTVEVFTGTNCDANTQIATGTITSCLMTVGGAMSPASALISSPGTPAKGKCGTPSGGMPGGSVSGSDPVTICCAP